MLTCQIPLQCQTLVGNLPYGISSALLRHFLRQDPPLRRMDTRPGPFGVILGLFPFPIGSRYLLSLSFGPSSTILWKYELTSKTILKRYLDPGALVKCNSRKRFHLFSLCQATGSLSRSKNKHRTQLDHSPQTQNLHFGGCAGSKCVVLSLRVPGVWCICRTDPSRDCQTQRMDVPVHIWIAHHRNPGSKMFSSQALRIRF